MAINQSEATFPNTGALDYQALMASIDGIFWEADAQTLQFTFVSQQAEQVLGYPLDQWSTPNFWLEHMHPEDREWAAAFCAQATQENRNHQFEYRMLTADGRTVWLRDIVSVLQEGGQVVKLCGVMVDITERKQAEEERKANLWFLESLDKVNRIMQGTNDVEQMMNDLLQTVLTIFHCDRAWLLSSQEPTSALWRPPLEQAQPAYPCTYDRAFAILTYPELAAVFALAQTVDGPICFVPQSPYQLSATLKAHLQIQSTMAMAIYPKGDAPYLFGLHQCSHARVWNAQEQRLLQEIGRRLTDGLTTLLAYRRLQESELRYREVFENTSDVISIVDVTADGRFRILDLNPAWEAVMGLARTEMIGQLLDDIQTSASARSALAHYQTCLQTKTALPYNDLLITPTGEWHMHITLVPICNAAGNVYRIVGVGRNVTEQKLAENELRVSETRFRTFVDHATDAFFLHDNQGTILDVNQQACISLGYTRAELIGMSPIHFDLDFTPAQMVGMNDHLVAGEVVTFERRHSRKDGTSFPAEISIRAFWMEGTRYAISLVRDISERKQAQAALQASEERYRILYEDNPTIYFTLDAAGMVLSVNPFGAAYLGYTVVELIGSTLLKVFCEEDQAAAQAYVAGCLAHPGQVFHWTLRKVRKDGTLLWVEETARTAYDVDGSLVLLIVCEDVTERKRTEQALIESHNLLHTIVEGTADAIFVKDLQGRYLLINQAGAQMIGRPVEAIIGQDDFALYPPEVANRIRMNDQLALTTEEAQLWEDMDRSTNTPRVYHTAKNVYRDAQGAVIGLIGISRDVTELKQLEEQFRQAQKMEALGRLAGGVAHDFNNLLTVINGYSQLLLKRAGPDDAKRTLLVEIQKAGERAAGLTGQLLAFSRKQLLQPQVVSLNKVLADLVHMLRRLIGEDIELVFFPDHTLGLTKIDPGQFEQAIINLAVNARDAMPSGGRLTIATRNVAFDLAYTERHPETRTGWYVCVTISDSGAGMDEITKARIFEPFFTTKGPGKGTGLGLAMVYGFIKQSDGHIEVVSSPGQGTTFTIYLPLIDAPPVTDKAGRSDPNLLEGTETILLVEDEKSVRELVADVLREHGYHVLEAAAPEAGLQIAATHPGPIHLLLTDMIMPRMDGRTLSQQLVTDRTDLKVLYMSGYTENIVAHHELAGTGVAFLQKPFTIDILLQKVRATLD